MPTGHESTSEGAVVERTGRIRQVMLDADAALLTMATLGYLGVGAQPPSFEWGRYWRGDASSSWAHGG